MSKAVRKDSTTNKMDPNNSGEEDSKKNLQVGLFFSHGKELECALMYNILEYLDLRSIQNVHSSLIKPLNKHYETEDFEKVRGLDVILKVALIYKKYSLTCPKGTPIVCACEKGNFDDVKYLWKGRRQISNDDDWISEVGTSSTGEEMTPLMAAVSKGNFKIADFLFGVCKINVNISNKEGYNAFHSVISYIKNHLPASSVDKDCLKFVCSLLSLMNVSNLKSENNELDAEKFLRKIMGHDELYTYLVHILGTKIVFEMRERQYYLNIFSEKNVDLQLIKLMYGSIDHNNYLFHQDYVMQEETPMGFSEFVRDRGLPEFELVDDLYNDNYGDVMVHSGLAVNLMSYDEFISY